LRILHVGKFYPPFHGGIENFLAALVAEQTRRGHHVAALVHSHEPGGSPGRPEVGSPFPWIIRAPCYGRLLYAPVSPSFPNWLHRVIADFRPDLLHLHLPNTSAFWALGLPAARKLPWVIHWHADVVGSNIDVRLKLAYRVYRPFEEAMLRRATAIVATSPPYRASSLALRPWLAKCHVVPLGLPPLEPEPELGPAPNHEEWQPGLLRVLAIGRLTYYKGFDTLIRAVARLPDAQAIIVGEGELRAALEDVLDASGAGDRIRLAGGLPGKALANLQNSCDVLVLCSIERTEAFGVVLLELMQRGKPVIVSDVAGSGMGWVVANGTTGDLVPPADVGALAVSIRRMGDAGVRRSLGVAGRDRFDQCFRIDRVAQAMDRVYGYSVGGIKPT
jgi:rhamnosyl/mannosyltransferase